MFQGGIRVNFTPKMRQSLLNGTPRSQMMPYFALPLHKNYSKKRLNWQQVLLRLAPTLVKVNDLTPLRQEFSNSAPKIFGVEYTDSTLAYVLRDQYKMQNPTYLGVNGIVFVYFTWHESCTLIANQTELMFIIKYMHLLCLLMLPLTLNSTTGRD